MNRSTTDILAPPVARRTFLTLMAGGVLYGAAGGPAGAAAPPELNGLNFSFLDVDREKIATCRQRGRGASVYGKGFLTRYREPDVRNAAKAILAKFREDAVTAIRHNLWFINEERAPRDVFSATRPDVAAEMLGLFIDDMRAAGLQSLFLSMSPVGQSLPGCRKVQWGDCFRADTVDSTMRFVTDVSKSAAGKLGRNLYLDPCNEGVPSNAVKQPLRTNMIEFLNTGLRTLAALRPAPRIVISTQANRADERLAIIEQLLADTKVRLDVLDIHVYGNSKTWPDAATLGQFRDFARRHGAALLVGEIQSDVETINHTRAALKKNDEGDPIGYFPWPLADPATGCHSDMNVIDVLGTMRNVRRGGN